MKRPAFFSPHNATPPSFWLYFLVLCWLVTHATPCFAQDALRRQKALLRVHKIKLYEKVLRTMTEATAQQRRQKASLFFHLASAYWEQSRYEWSQARARHSKAMQRWRDRCRGHKGTKPCPPAPRLSLAASEAYGHKSIATFRKILKDFPYYPRNEEILAELGSNLLDMKQEKAALAIYQRLRKQYPGSRHLPSVDLTLGQLYFQKNKVAQAMKHFRQALRASAHRFKAKKTPPSQKIIYRGIHLQALYMFAWCDFNIGEFEKATKALKRVVALSTRYKKTMESRANLQTQALRDLVLFFSKMTRTKRAYAYFKATMGADYAKKASERLATTYTTTGDYLTAIRTYRLLQGIDRSARSIHYQAQIFACAFRIWNHKKILAELRLLETYLSPKHPKHKAWKRQALWQQAHKETQNSLLVAIRSTTPFWQKARSAKKKRQTKRFLKALCRTFLGLYPSHQQAAKLTKLLQQLGD